MKPRNQGCSTGGRGEEFDGSAQGGRSLEEGLRALVLETDVVAYVIFGSRVAFFYILFSFQPSHKAEIMEPNTKAFLSVIITLGRRVCKTGKI